jgi:hypothetical protein
MDCEPRRRGRVGPAHSRPTCAHRRRCESTDCASSRSDCDQAEVVFAGTCTASGRSIVVPSPRRPPLLHSHPNTRPVPCSARECPAPAVTRVMPPSAPRLGQEPHRRQSCVRSGRRVRFFCVSCGPRVKSRTRGTAVPSIQPSDVLSRSSAPSGTSRRPAPQRR